MSEALYTFYCAFESATRLPDFTWEEDNQYVVRHFGARAAARDFAREYHVDETDENRVVVFNKDTGKITVWDITVEKLYHTFLVEE